MAAVAGMFGPGGDDRGHQRRRMQKDQSTNEGKTPDGFSEP